MTKGIRKSMNEPAQKAVEQEENFEALDDSGFELESSMTPRRGQGQTSSP